jgi:hypothetical protein
MLAPNTAIVKEFLSNLLVSYQSITLAAISLQQSQFFPEENPPEWMITLQNELTTAQGIATDWLVNNGPTVISNIPYYFANYGTSMQVVAKTINAPATTQMQALQSLNWLKGRIAAVPAQEKALYQIIADFSKKFDEPRNEIQQALTDANSDITQDQAKTLDLQNQINVLYQSISSETVKASNGMTSVITSGASLSFGLLSFSYAVAAGSVIGPVGVVLGVVIAIGGLTIGAITNAINEKEIAENLAKIRDLQVTLLKENQSIAILQNLTTMLHNLNDAIAGIKGAMDSSSIWVDESNKLNAAITELQNYSGDNFQSLQSISTFQTAAQAWGEIATMALNLQKAVTGMPNIVISIPS